MSIATRRRALIVFTLGLLTAVSPPMLWAAEGGGIPVSSVLFVLAAMLVGGKLLGELAERLGQPAVLGELVAGVLLGPSLLGVVPLGGIDGEFITTLAEMGVLLLLFEIGLETNLKEMLRVGPAALAVAAVGVGIPFALGYGYWVAVPHPYSTPEPSIPAIFLGATLTATSVGITARVLADLGQMNGVEAKIIIGAAVIDDVLGLVILSVVSGLAAGVSVTAFGVTRIFATAVGFLVAAVLIGNFVMPRLFNLVERMRVRHVLVVFAVAFAFGLAALAEVAGSALIIGSFAAGIILSGTNQFKVIEEEVRPVAAIFTPIFFVKVGSFVDVGLLNPFRPGASELLIMAAVVTALAIVGKLAAGWAAPWHRFRPLTVGMGMVPRGEVGLIFADIGRRSGVLSGEVFNVVLLMVMATTFVGPLGLKAILGRGAPRGSTARTT